MRAPARPQTAVEELLGVENATERLAGPEPHAIGQGIHPRIVNLRAERKGIPIEADFLIHTRVSPVPSHTESWVPQPLTW